jgi:hypothetical protein
MGGNLESVGAGGAVGKQSNVCGQMMAEWIAEGDRMGRFPCKCADDLLPGVDAAGAAEFAKVFGKQRPECDLVAASGGLQECCSRWKR